VSDQGLIELLRMPSRIRIRGQTKRQLERSLTDPASLVLVARQGDQLQGVLVGGPIADYRSAIQNSGLASAASI